jgi:DNA-directed RNA polymerase subunit beta'
MTKIARNTPEMPTRGEGSTFYSPEEVIIAYNESRVDLHAFIKVRIMDMSSGKPERKIVETTVGRVLFNEVVPQEVGFINEILTKKSLREIISNVLKRTGTAQTAKFLDSIKDLGFQMAFKGGLSFNLDDVIIPQEKEELMNEGYEQVDEVMNNYNMGFITNNERYNQIIDIQTPNLLRR